jgi:hypothetical protein
MSDEKLGFFHFLQRLFGRGDEPRPTEPAPATKNSPSHVPRTPPGKGAAKKEPSSDKPAKKEPPSDAPAKKEPSSRDKPAKRLAAKPAACWTNSST